MAKSGLEMSRSASQFPSQTYFKKIFFSLNLSNHFYSEQVCSGIDVLLTPVQDHSDAPNIKLSRDIPNGVELNYILLKWYYDQNIISFFLPILKAYSLNIQLAKF